MDTLLNRIVRYIISNQIIPSGKESWLRYGLEKRLTTIVVCIPFSILAIVISEFWIAVTFMGSFFFLRRQANGFHARSSYGCLLESILLELLFLGFLSPHLNATYIIVLMAISLIIIFLLAPYNHPNMNLTHEEYIACKRISRIRAIQAAFLVIVFLNVGLIDAAKGISLGCSMASFLLGLAYISDRRTI